MPTSIRGSNASVVEGASGTKQIVFDLHSSAPITCGLTAKLTHGTTSDADFLSTAPVTTVFSGTTASITFTVVGDAAIEPDEIFTIAIAGSGATPCVIASCLLVGYIANDDPVGTEPRTITF